jgi:hypothetical protein
MHPKRNQLFPCFSHQSAVWCVCCTGKVNFRTKSNLSQCERGFGNICAFKCWHVMKFAVTIWKANLYIVFFFNFAVETTVRFLNFLPIFQTHGDCCWTNENANVNWKRCNSFMNNYFDRVARYVNYCDSSYFSSLLRPHWWNGAFHLEWKLFLKRPIDGSNDLLIHIMQFNIIDASK